MCGRDLVSVVPPVLRTPDQNLHAVNLPFIGDLFWSSQGTRKAGECSRQDMTTVLVALPGYVLAMQKAAACPPLWKFLILWLEVKCLLDFLSKCFPN